MAFQFSEDSFQLSLLKMKSNPQFVPNSNKRGSQQEKSSQGVNKMQEEARLEELRKKYMESFGRKRHRRRKRHVGPHDEGGLQRLISTGKTEEKSAPYMYRIYNISTCMGEICLI